MTQQEITLLNLGQSLDDLANLDPRGYGVCKILYSGSRKLAGKPLCVNAAEKLVATLKENDIVYILTGFVLHPYKKAETDGIISSMLLCRALVKAFQVRPVIICPEENRKAVENLSACVGLHLREDLQELRDIPLSMGMVTFTKDAAQAPAQADEILSALPPAAVISTSMKPLSAASPLNTLPSTMPPNRPTPLASARKILGLPEPLRISSCIPDGFFPAIRYSSA